MKTKSITIILISIGSLFLGTFSLANNELAIIGRIEGIGTFFEIKDSQYLNISLKSSEEIKVVLESIPRMIGIHIEAATEEIKSTNLTLEGLEPNKTYFKYQDSYKSETVFVSDENGSYSWTQDLSQSHHIWFQEIKSTVFLPEDCSKYGTWNETTKTCTLNQDLTQSVEIALIETQTDNITLDCNNHQVSGSGAYGIFLNGFWKRYTGGLKNVTVKNCKVSNFSYGIYAMFTTQSNLENNTSSNNYVGIELVASPSNFLIQNTVERNRTGLYLSNSANNFIAGNKVQLNEWGLIIEAYSGNNILRNNVISDNQNSLFLCIDTCWPSVDPNQDIDTSNTINGKPIYYLVNQTDKEIPGDAGFVGLVNSSNITVKNLNLDVPNFYAIFLASTNNSTIENNIISNSQFGIYLNSSTNNTFTENTIKNNQSGAVYLYDSSNNLFFHNNFIDNGSACPKVYTWPITNINFFDNGYPSGGNYWSDYTGTDLKSGVNQDQDGSDRIGDIPQYFYYYSYGVCTRSSQKDNYPFVKENGWEILINQPPTISEIDQFRSDGRTLIGEGTITTESTVVFKATLNDSDNDQVKLQIELKKYNQPFDGLNILESGLISSGNEAAITATDLTNGQYKWRARAVDFKEAVSAWQEFGEIGNVDFEVKLVPLYTQVFSKYPSELETLLWSRRNYAYATPEKPYSSCGWLIRDCGCAITSMVMLGRYYDIGIAIDGSNVDPGNINTWLTNNKGYELNGDLRWGNTIEYLGFIDEGTGKKMARLDFKPKTDFNVSSASPRIDNFLALAKPIVARSKTFGHYFVIDGKIKAGTIDYTYTLKDPTWYNTKRLNQPKNLTEHIQGYNNHFDTANLFSYLETPKPITASIYIHLASPAELLITDPLGRKLGKDPAAGIVYDEIPDSIYTQEGPIVSSDTPLDPNEIPESKIIYIPSPIDGEYDIKVIGTDSGSYTIGLSLYDDNGNSKDIAKEGNTITNDIQEFKLDFSTQTVQETEVYRIVNIDIKPGSYPNSINLKSRGVLPVAVLTDNFFDAKDIVVNSVLFAGAEPLRSNLEDVDKDGDLDLILHFDTRSLKLTFTDTEAILSARLKDNALIKGTDSVRIVGELGFLASIINATRGIIDTIVGAISNFFGLQ